jgi:biopolymer transport protein ExbD
MLVLLVIVLTTASFIQTGLIKVDLPTSAAKPNIQEKKELVISIDKNGEISVNSKSVSIVDIENILKTYPKNSMVKFYCDKDAKFDNFVTVLDIIKNNGFENLGIVTKND